MRGLSGNINVVNTAENTVALGLVIGLLVLGYYAWKKATSGISAAGDAVGEGIDKVNSVISNPFTWLAPFTGAASDTMKVLAKPIQDLANVDENGVLKNFNNGMDFGGSSGTGYQPDDPNNPGNAPADSIVMP